MLQQLPWKAWGIGLRGPGHGGDRGAMMEALEARRLLSASIDLAALMPPDLAANDRFGYSVAAQGDLLLVGAPGVNSGAGEAYLFNFATGALQATFSGALDHTPGGFGTSVAFMGDHVVIGAPATSIDGMANAGAAYLFRADEAVMLAAAEAGSDNFFGATVAGFDNNHLLIQTLHDRGDHGRNGRVHLFNAAGEEVRSFINPARSLAHPDSFGSAIAVSGDQILIGAPTARRAGIMLGGAFLFDAADSEAAPRVVYNPVARPQAFGAAVAFADGDMIIGAPADRTWTPGVGAAYRFAEDGSLRQTYATADAAAGDGFGSALVAAGDSLFIGAPGDRMTAAAGAVYTIDRISGAVRTRTANPDPDGNEAGEDRFGSALAPLGREAVAIGAWGADAQVHGALRSAGAVYLTGADFRSPASNPGRTPLEPDHEEPDHEEPAASAGWTMLDPSEQTRIIYVSSSTGSDDNSGLSPEAPLQSIAAGIDLLRDEQPDWLLLQKGDVWHEPLGIWRKSGASAEAPMVVGSYGEGPRPLLLTGSGHALRTESTPVRHVAFTGLHFRANTYTGAGHASNGPMGVRWMGAGNNILLEDMKIQGYKDNIVIDAYHGPVTDFKLRRSVIVDAYSHQTHSQGLYASGVEGLLIEQNVFDHNGWRNGDRSDATIFNHNIYIQHDNQGLQVKGNIIMRASSHGLQARPGGIVEGNLFIQNPIGMVMLKGGEIRDNVFLEGSDINGGALRGMGINLQRIEPELGAIIEGNIIANYAGATPWGNAIELTGDNGIGLNNVTVEGNTIYNWLRGLLIRGGRHENVTIADNIIQDQGSSGPLAELFWVPDPSVPKLSGNIYDSGRPPGQWFEIYDGSRQGIDMETWIELTGETDSVAEKVAFVDAERTLATYQESLGRDATVEAFMRQVGGLSRDTWDDVYSAAALLGYFHAGFVPAGDAGRVAD